MIAAPLPTGWKRRLVLVDDASTAATRAVAERLAVELGPLLTLVRHQINHGKGAALRTGFQEVLRSATPGDMVVIQDADLEYDPADIARLITECDPETVVYGNRWGGQDDGDAQTHSQSVAGGLWRRLHRCGNQALTVCSNLATGYEIDDMECCYKLLPVGVLERTLPLLTEDRFGVEPQITAVLAHLGVPIRQVPVSYSARGMRDGKKIGPRDAVRALWVILRERTRRASRMRESPPAASPMRLLIQMVAFAAGLALIGACIWKALDSGDWDRLSSADPLLIIGALGFGLGSLAINGVIFWLTAAPLRKLKAWDVQAVNAMATFLNYAPLRAGLISRLLYHIRVDGIPTVPVLAWMAVVAVTMVIALGSIALATLLAPIAAPLWWAVVLACAFTGTIVLRHPGKLQWVRSKMQGAQSIIDSPLALGAGVGLRLIDIGCWIGRMACVAAILGTGLSAADVVLVAIAGIVVSMNPLGRVGFREAAVAFVAARLTSAGGMDIDTIFVQLAVLESAAEAAVAIPTGVIGTGWCIRCWRASKRAAMRTSANQ